MIKKYKRIYKNKSEKGIALVEVIAALGIATIVITALVSLSISTMRSSLKSKLLLEGSKIANREIELVRAYRDNNDWATFLVGVNNCKSPSAGSPCSMELNASAVVGHATQEGTGTEAIIREFYISNTGGIVRVFVSVTWEVGDVVTGTYIQTDLTNWRAR